jgi:hypothetical protein
MKLPIKQSLWSLGFAALCALLSGCPANDYTVELQPRAEGGVERTLTFYRADGTDSHGDPSYQEFPTNELAAITRLYPAGSVTANGWRYTANGTFAGPLPSDVGGAGSYTNVATSLGEAGLYVERFRGNDDLAGETAKRFHAADEMTDLIVGWTRMEFGGEPGYKNLRKFLDHDLRPDLKNAALYAWLGGAGDVSDTKGQREFTFRFLQYLYERGYLKLSDTRDVYLLIEDEEDDSRAMGLLRRFFMEKLGVDPSEPPPKSFAVLDSADSLQKSWEKYLAGTDLYRAKVKDWEEKKKSDPNLTAPGPDDAALDLAMVLLSGGNDSSGASDHLTVKLKLAHPPFSTNGKWKKGQVVWSDDLDVNRPLPAFCYATWSNPNAQFQEQHFGSVVLDDDTLAQYCFWEETLSAEQAHEWQSFLENLQPGLQLTNHLAAFHFSGSPPLVVTNGQQDYTLIGRKLLMDALAK